MSILSNAIEKKITEMHIDGHQCLKSGNISKSRGWLDSPQSCDSLMILKNSTDTKIGLLDNNKMNKLK